MTGKPDSLTLPAPLAAPHLAGILGDGQSALAALLRHDGADVSGCDVGGKRSSEKQGTLSDHLAQLGIPVSAGHDPAHLPGQMTALVYSAAIPAGHAELDAARRLGLPVLRRHQALSLDASLFGQVVAVAGGAGKTSTSAVLAAILTATSWQPTVYLGARSPNLEDRNYRHGQRQPLTAAIVPPQPAEPSQKPRPLFSGRLNRRGTLEAQFRLPAGLTGAAELHFIADTPIGSTEYTQSIRLDDKASILLTTEKPIYQPGQTIHVRALALDRDGHQADSARKLTFELEDSRGNKVFKKITETDKFGIASAEFSLADEVNLGTYHLRALMGSSAAPSNTAEIALDVEHYVLPKFKVDVEFTQKDGKPKRDYRPGDHVTGTVRANYFFGKPVDHADVTIKASSMDVAVFEAASATGKTDDDGGYRFDLKLPGYFAGRPLSQGA